MNLNLIECQIKEALKRVIDTDIKLKPFIALNNADFLFSQNHAYIGRFHGASEFSATSRINNEVVIADSLDNVIFTELGENPSFGYFQGYQIEGKSTLYAPKSYAFWFSSLYDACIDPHPTDFENQKLYSATNDPISIDDDGRTWFMDEDLTIPVASGAYAHSALTTEVINLDVNGVQTALVCK